MFAELRQRQRLTRFRRRGLDKVKVEFALHCMAFNLRKAAASAQLLVIFVLMVRVPANSWKLAVGGYAILPPAP